MAQRIELTPQPQADAGLLHVVPGRRTVLKPTGRAFDAAAATRAERDAQARRTGGPLLAIMSPRDPPA